MLKPLSFLSILFIVLGAACERTQPLPKPRAYPKFSYPERSYQRYQSPDCAFSFEFPGYSRIAQDTTHRNDPFFNDCWFDVYMPDFDCRLYCSYYRIGEGKTLDELKRDAFEMVDWHHKKANYIEEQRIQRGEDIEGLAFRIEGPAATPFEFFLTDNKEHFFRAALYFNTQINTDSLAPLYDFVLKDVEHLIGTFAWKK